MKTVFDPDFRKAHLMGPDAIEVADSLTRCMELNPGMRVLDLGNEFAQSDIPLVEAGKDDLSFVIQVGRKKP